MKLTKIPEYKVGDKVTRLIAGSVAMELTVMEIRGDRLVCGHPGGIGDPEMVAKRPSMQGWEFHRLWGYEIDDDLGWGQTQPDGSISATGSFLVPKETHADG